LSLKQFWCEDAAMSMITEYVRLRPHELAELYRLLVEDPDEAYEYAADLRMGDLGDEVSSRGMDTDKAWAGLQYLLDRLSTPVDVISGGVALTGDHWGYDAPRLLSVDDVAQAATFLDATAFSLVAAHFDPGEMTASEIYPGIWGEQWALSYLEEYYERLVQLLHAAAEDREPILIWMG
jgi:hypothetical protein